MGITAYTSIISYGMLYRERDDLAILLDNQYSFRERQSTTLGQYSIIWDLEFARSEISD